MFVSARGVPSTDLHLQEYKYRHSSPHWGMEVWGRGHCGFVERRDIGLWLSHILDCLAFEEIGELEMVELHEG